jgi:hypothetical protein
MTIEHSDENPTDIGSCGLDGGDSPAEADRRAAEAEAGSAVGPVIGAFVGSFVAAKILKRLGGDDD